MHRQVANFRPKGRKQHQRTFACFLYVSAHFKTNLSLILLHPPIEGWFYVFITLFMRINAPAFVSRPHTISDLI